MAFFEDAIDTVTESGLGTGIIIVGAATLLWPFVGPVLREAAKFAIKGGIVAYRYGSQIAAEASEGISDLAAEARQEARAG